MLPFRRILVALAANETDAGLLDYAAMLGSWCTGAEFLFVHVSQSSDPLVAASLQKGVQLRFPSRSDHRISSLLLPGDRMDALLEFSLTRQPDLILLGHRTSRSGRRSLARRLAMEAPSSIWMVPEGCPAKLERILVPVDFSRQAGDALEVGTSIAEAAGLDELNALHVHFNEAATSSEEYEESLSEEEDRGFCLFVAPIDLHGVHVKPLFVEGPIVAHTVLRMAEELKSDLIVMGTRGRSRSAAVLLGSETEHVIRETSRPVLAVKHFGARRRLLQVLLDRRVRDRGGNRFT